MSPSQCSGEAEREVKVWREGKLWSSRWATKQRDEFLIGWIVSVPSRVDKDEEDSMERDKSLLETFCMTCSLLDGTNEMLEVSVS